MQRPSNKQSRAANSAEKAFLAWCKEQPSIVSGKYGVEVHHCIGSSGKARAGLERVHIGHWFCLPLTTQEHWLFHHRKKEFEFKHGHQTDLWLKLIENYELCIPQEVIEAIIKYGK